MKLKQDYTRLKPIKNQHSTTNNCFLLSSPSSHSIQQLLIAYSVIVTVIVTYLYLQIDAESVNGLDANHVNVRRAQHVLAQQEQLGLPR